MGSVSTLDEFYKACLRASRNLKSIELDYGLSDDHHLDPFSLGELDPFRTLPGGLEKLSISDLRGPLLPPFSPVDFKSVELWKCQVPLEDLQTFGFRKVQVFKYYCEIENLAHS